MVKRLRADKIAGIISKYDFVIDGSDNFPTKFLINDACWFRKVPFSHAGILRFTGQAMTWLPGTACYRCVFPEPPPSGAVPTCREAGILVTAAGIMGMIQAAEALRYLLGNGTLLTNHLLVMDALEMDFRPVTIRNNPDCPLCGENPTVTGLIDYEQAACSV